MTPGASSFAREWVAFLSQNRRRLVIDADTPVTDQVDVHHVIPCALLRHGDVLAKTTKVDCAGESLEELVRVSIVVWTAGLWLP